MQNGLYSLIILGIILGLIIITLYIYKKTAMQRFLGDKQVEIINQIALGGKERLFVLKIKEQLLLVGVTAQSMSTLHVWTKEK